jgi:hypothetical protein
VRCFAAATLRGLKIKETGRGIRIGGGMSLTSEPAFLKFTKTRSFIDLVGIVQNNAYRSSDAVIHGEVELPYDERLVAADKFIDIFLRSVNQFLMALWLVKDNSVICTGGYLFLADPPAGNPGMVIHHLGIYYWHSELSRERIAFSTDELRAARENLASYIPRLGIAPQEDMAVSGTIPVRTPRLARAWYFAENARMSADVSVKVATYVTCLEALLSTEEGELTHRLAERVARMLGATPLEQRKLFSLVKDAYDIRSKTLHGASLGKRINKLLPTAAASDDIVRQLFLKILSSQQLVTTFNEGALSGYFLDLLFGPVSIRADDEMPSNK